MPCSDSAFMRPLMLTVWCGAIHQVTPAAEEHTATMIFLHGFGSQGPGRGKLVAESLNIPWCKIVCPLAPSRAGALGQGLQSWSSVDLLLEKVGALVLHVSSRSSLTSSICACGARAWC